MQTTYSIAPGGLVSGSFSVPGDKSITHRAYILSTIAKGQSIIENALKSEDCEATRQALVNIGGDFAEYGNGVLTVTSQGISQLSAPKSRLDLGNSGTGMRLLAGLLAGQPFSTELTGDSSLQKRPMARIIRPLSAMGASIQGVEQQYPPLSISGQYRLKPITYELPVPSAQVKSAIMLAAMQAKGQTNIIEPIATRDHTERLLNYLGYPIDKTKTGWSIEGGHVLKAGHIVIPGDISSAFFLLSATALLPNSHCILNNIGLNPMRLGGVRILKAMGANISIKNQRMVCGEPVGDIEVCSSDLTGIDIPEAWVPDAIDEFPMICIAAACAKGDTIIKGASELRVKESDRLSVMAKALDVLGIHYQEYQDGIRIQGGNIKGGRVHAQSDHRTAMSLIIAGMVSQKGVIIDGCDGITTSFPNFLSLMKNHGLNIQEESSCEI